MLVYAAYMLIYYVSQQFQYQNVQSSSYYHYYHPLLLSYTETWLSLHSFKLKKRKINVKFQIPLISREMVVLTKTIFTSTLNIQFPLQSVQVHAKCTKNHYLIYKNDEQKSFGEHYMQEEAKKCISAYQKATEERDWRHCRPSFPGRL